MPLKSLLLLALMGSGVALFAQEGAPEEQRFTIDTPASLDFKKEEDPVSDKKKKVKKKVYYGIKTKKPSRGKDRASASHTSFFMC
jgi:hypothetical protein